MVDPESVANVLLDAARLVRDGEIVVFGSAALAFSLEGAPRTRDVDLWVDPPERGEPVEALMGELSWYHERHGAYVEVWGPETFAAPTDWRVRARVLTEPAAPGVRLVVPHPHDVLLSKVEHWQPADREHAVQILDTYPLSPEGAAILLARCPHRAGLVTDPLRLATFEANARRFLAWLRDRP